MLPRRAKSEVARTFLFTRQFTLAACNHFNLQVTLLVCASQLEGPSGL